MTRRFAQRRRSIDRLPLVALAALLGTVPSFAQKDTAAVRVAGHAVSSAALRDAILHCRRDAPALELHTCIKRHFGPLFRLDREVERRKLKETPEGHRHSSRLLYEALYQQFQNASTPPPAEAVEAYLKQHQRDFVKPERIRIFRIVVSSKEAAQQLLDDLDADTTPAEFRDLSRTHSIDSATAERGGDLGFVWPDGTTDVPQLKTEPTLYKHASEVPDGSFVPQPVPEGKHFAVVWRRGSLPSVRVPQKQAEALARRRLTAAAVTQKMNAVVEREHPKTRPQLLKKLNRPESKIFER